MAQDKRRILITGVSRFLGLRLAKALEGDDTVETLVGVDLEEPPVPIEGLEFVRADIRNPLIARVLDSTGADTLVHTNISSRPGVLGGRTQMKETNVIGTMQLMAAAQRSESLRRVVMKSSGAVYGSQVGEPSILPEDHSARTTHLSGYGKDCAEAETFARDFGRRRPDVELTVLRTQSVVGPTVRSSMVDYLSLPVIPTALGFDPRLQLLHEVDAVEALKRATLAGTPGIYNIAASGVVYLSQAIRLMGAVPLPLMLPLVDPTAAVLRRFGVIDFPADQIKLLLHGRVVDIRRARAELGFVPRYSTESCVLELRDKDRADRLAEPAARSTWQEDLRAYLEARSSRETV